MQSVMNTTRPEHLMAYDGGGDGDCRFSETPSPSMWSGTPARSPKEGERQWWGQPWKKEVDIPEEKTWKPREEEPWSPSDREPWKEGGEEESKEPWKEKSVPKEAEPKKKDWWSVDRSTVIRSAVCALSYAAVVSGMLWLI